MAASRQDGREANLRNSEQQRHRNNLLRILRTALSAVHGRTRVRDYLRSHPLSGKVYLVAIGKAAQAMAQGAHEVLGRQIVRGLIIAKASLIADDVHLPLSWQVINGSHPVPDEDSLHAGRALLQFIGAAPADARFLFLTSGGSSSLVEVLPSGVGLAELQRCYTWLLGADLDIGRMNRIRSGLSLIKAGGLLACIEDREVLNLLISDVPGDDIATIGSGLLSPGTVPVAEAMAGVPVPQWLRALLSYAAQQRHGLTSGSINICHKLIANTDDIRLAAASSARESGYEVRVDELLMHGNALDAGRRAAREILASPGVLQIWGGETTVKLPSRPGVGGRNQSLALAAAIEIDGRGPAMLLAAATDGEDAGGNVAGALIDDGSIRRGRQQGHDEQRCLQQADAGTFLAASGDLISTGPTGTNVMDLVFGLNDGGAFAR